jgi:L-threonylcarbamoyladenylate synthase
LKKSRKRGEGVPIPFEPLNPDPRKTGLTPDEMNGRILKASRRGIEKAAQWILQGKVVAFPTETFYGLGVDALDAEALQKIFRVKQREEDKPLLLLIADRTWLPGLVQNIPPRAGPLMQRFWPGPLTLVFEASAHLSPLLTANTGKIGLRISSHPVARALVQVVGRAITATSANVSGQPGASEAREVFRSLGEKIDAILDGGKTPGGFGSTVIEVCGVSSKIIRQGAIPRAELAPFLTE